MVVERPLITEHKKEQYETPIFAGGMLDALPSGRGCLKKVAYYNSYWGWFVPDFLNEYLVSSGRMNPPPL
jgi:hypothetical protein